MKITQHIFKFLIKETKVAPDGKTPAHAISIKVLEDPLELFNFQNSLFQTTFTELFLKEFNEVTLSYLDNGIRIELLPYQNADKATITFTIPKTNKIINNVVEQVFREKAIELNLSREIKLESIIDFKGNTTVTITE